MDASSWVDSGPVVEVQDERYECVSPLLSPSQDKAESTTYDVIDAADQRIEEGVSSYLKPENAFRTRMRLVQFRNHLIRCQLLYLTVMSMERKPWKSHSHAQLAQYYRNIRCLAIKARNVAEAIGSDDLRARAEYWAGRGCGGLQDCQAAITHFATAIKFDVPNYTDNNGKIFQRGLLQDEKEDVEFLLQSVKQRNQEWESRKDDVYEAEFGVGATHSYPIELHWEGLIDARWTPDRDRIIHIAKQQHGSKRRPMARFTNTETGASDYTKDEVHFIFQRMSLDDENELVRKTLSEEEWRYIICGDESRYGGEEYFQQLQQSDNSLGTAVLSSTTSVSSSDGLPVENEQDVSLDLDNENVEKQRPNTSPTPSPLAMTHPASFNRQGRDTSSPAWPTIMKRRKKNVESIRTPAMAEQVQRLDLSLSTVSQDDGENGEESEGEMVDVRLDRTPSVEKGASRDDETPRYTEGSMDRERSLDVEGSVDDESRENTPRTAR